MRALAALALLIAGVSAAQDIPFGGRRSFAAPAVSCSADCTFTGTTTVTGHTFALGVLTMTGVAATNAIVTNTPDSITSATVAAMTFTLGADITAADLGWSFKDSSGNIALKLTEAGNLTPLQNLLPSGNTTVDLGAINLGWNNVFAKTYQDYNGTARASTQISAGSAYNGAISDGATAVGHAFGNSNTLATAGAKIVRFCNGAATNAACTGESANVLLNGFYVQPAQTVTVATDGAGTSPATNITATSNLVLMAYNDPDNLSVGSLIEPTSATQQGTVVRVVHTGSGGTVAFAEISGQQEMGTIGCIMGLDDVMEVIWANSAWHLVSCEDN